ncbi:MAG: hypothetical protein ACYDFU_07085, partial [Nitrospirota bacterium]
MPKKATKTSDALSAQPVAGILATGLPTAGSAQYYEEVLYAIPEGVMVFDGSLRLVSANRAAQELAMLSAEAIGKTAREAFGSGNQGLAGLVS